MERSRPGCLDNMYSKQVAKRNATSRTVKATMKRSRPICPDYAYSNRVAKRNALKYI